MQTARGRVEPGVQRSRLFIEPLLNVVVIGRLMYQASPSQVGENIVAHSVFRCGLLAAVVRASHGPAMLELPL